MESLSSYVTSHKKVLLFAALLVVLGFGIYAVNLHNRLFWDDTDWIVNNPAVHSFSWQNIKFWLTHNTLAGIGLKSNYYRPFLFLTFTANYVAHGISPVGYHLVNNLLHIFNALLVLGLILYGTKRFWVAAVTSVIFLVHPLQTEAVTYVAGRGDPLNVFFMLVALWLVIKAQGASSRSWMWHILGVLCMVMAVLSRETAIIFPLLVTVYFVAFMTRQKFWPSLKSALFKTWPYWAVSIVYGLLRLTVLNFENTLNFYSRANPYADSVLVRMYTFLGILVTYFKILIVPVGLHMERGATVFQSLFYPRVFLPLLVIVALVALLVRLYRREQANPSDNDEISAFRILFFAVGWFFVNLLLTSGITPINALLYEHWLYLAMVGPLVLVGYGFNYLRQNFSHRKLIKVSLLVLLVGVVSLFSFLTVKRNIAWGNPLTFFEDILRYEPNSARINNNVGNIYYDQGDKTKAEEYYWKAVGAEDAFPQPHYNLGSILLARGDTRGAVVEFEKAIAVDPNFPNAYEGLAIIYAQQGDLVKTRDMLQKFILLRPDNPVAYYNLARVELVLKNPQAAVKALVIGLQVSDKDPEARRLITELLSRLSGPK